ncbi:pyruvate kinase [Candidatus Pacearchaeota archaeon]|nr:pyruvate kinase [Candidatus Pacearchaeota archaeon]
MAKTKILATIGPASADKVEGLVKVGLDGIRFNMSHIPPEKYDFTFNLIKDIRAVNPDLFLVGDLQGPKIRLGDFPPLQIKPNDEIKIVPALQLSQGEIPIQLETLYQYVEPGHILLVDDGNASLEVKSISNKTITCIVQYGEVLNARKGVNVPDVSIPVDYLSKNDALHLRFMAGANFDYVSASYSRNREDILKVKEMLEGTGIKVIGKPENREGISNLDDIINEADAMMVPRGDLGMEIGVVNVPVYQKIMINKCRAAGKPVITATQMLESMMRCKEPKRAEVSDIFNAVLDGTDAVMLSGETSIGNYPIEAVDMMNKIIERAEGYLFSNEAPGNEKGDFYANPEMPADSISKAVYGIASTPHIKAILVPTSTGYTARMISRFRINKPIIAVTYDPKVKTQLNAVWGVIPLLTERLDEKYILDSCIKLAREKGHIGRGDRILITGGSKMHGKGTNLLRIEDVE